jgi:hypothetical protein
VGVVEVGIGGWWWGRVMVRCRGVGEEWREGL